MKLDAHQLHQWRQRYRDATREGDPDNHVKSLHDCRDLLLECFEPLANQIEWLDEQCGRLAMRVANAETRTPEKVEP